MLYILLKNLFRITLRIFFRRITIKNRDLLLSQGPLIVVSNHPNTLMDPVVTASFMKQEVFFLAKSSFFRPGWQAWLLHKLFMIPVYRREDVGDNASGQNTDTFEKCYEFLANKGTLMVFPEGNSFMQRRLRPLKTGTARIALGAEAQRGFNLDLKIVPVGLNYSAPSKFRSEVFVQVGAPIIVANFKIGYAEDNFKAAQRLTEVIKEQLEALIIHTDSEEEDSLVRQVEAVYQDHLVKELDLADTEPEEKFLITKGIVQSIKYFETHDPERVHALRASLKEYLVHLENLGLRSQGLNDAPKAGQVAWGTVQTVLYLVLGFPVYLFGLLHNYLPYLLPAKVARSLTKDVEFHAPMMMTVGMFTFPLFYAFLGWAAHAWLGLSGWGLVAYLLALPLTGFFTLHYWHRVGLARRQWVFFSLFYRRSTVLQHLLAQRTQLMADLEQARQEYIRGDS